MTASQPRQVAFRAALARLWRLALAATRRAYALAMILLITWVSYRALRYLVTTLMYPSAVPEQITGIPVRLDEALLQTRRSAWAGMQLSEHPRTPPAHYHRLDAWIQPDPYNDCTRAGCHAPLPHARRKEVRAFLNMHATTLHCGICHLRPAEQPLPTVWYDLHTGAVRGAPTVLQTYAWLVSEQGRRQLAAPDEQVQRRLTAELRTAARDADDDPVLSQLAEHIAAVRYSSPEFLRFVETARQTLPRHFRGEYGAKLAVRGGDGRPVLGHPGSQQAVERYLREAPFADAARRAELLAALHPLRRQEPAQCGDCHGDGERLIDLHSAGYPAARIEMLSQPLIFRMVESISQGQPFYLPTLIPPAAAPDQSPSDSHQPR